MTTMSGPMHLPLPPAPPAPIPGCVICADLERKRAEAKTAADYSRVSDCNVRMRRHRHRTTPISR